MTPGLSHVASDGTAGKAASDVAAVASLDEPTRRRIYEHVRAQAAPLSRDDVADALQITRQSAAFHLDRLAEQGLLAVTFARRSGRSGPGAGRTAKLYQRSAREVSVSLPPRHYDLAGRLLAGAVAEAEQTGQPVQEVLERRARGFGWAMAREQPGRGDVRVLINLLEDHGYEPRATGSDVILRNCPFHAMAQEHAELVCGMNLHLLEGVLAGLGRTGLQANLDPAPSRCCVRLENSDHPEQP
jgi:predicted ArsR family transcriptional regulator